MRQNSCRLQQCGQFQKLSREWHLGSRFKGKKKGLEEKGEEKGERKKG